MMCWIGYLCCWMICMLLWFLVCILSGKFIIGCWWVIRVVVCDRLCLLVVSVIVCCVWFGGCVFIMMSCCVLMILWCRFRWVVWCFIIIFVSLLVWVCCNIRNGYGLMRYVGWCWLSGLMLCWWCLGLGMWVWCSLIGNIVGCLVIFCDGILIVCEVEWMLCCWLWWVIDCGVVVEMCWFWWDLKSWNWFCICDVDGFGLKCWILICF